MSALSSSKLPMSRRVCCRMHGTLHNILARKFCEKKLKFSSLLPFFYLTHHSVNKFNHCNTLVCSNFPPLLLLCEECQVELSISNCLKIEIMWGSEKIIGHNSNFFGRSPKKSINFKNCPKCSSGQQQPKHFCSKCESNSNFLKNFLKTYFDSKYPLGHVKCCFDNTNPNYSQNCTFSNILKIFLGSKHFSGDLEISFVNTNFCL